MKLIRKITYPLSIIIILFIFICIIVIKNNLNKRKYNHIEENKEIIKDEFSNSEPLSDINNKYNVDIKGAIKNPGVYQLESNLTVNDAIKVAGGLTKDADTSLINLAKKISDEMVIIIYTKEEVKNSNIVNTVIKVVEKECICPNIENDSCLNNEIKDTITNTEQGNLVNINTATIDELKTIKGIGEGKAKSIIDYRTKNGNFKNIEDIKNVEGIGESLYETIKVYITT